MDRRQTPDHFFARSYTYARHLPASNMAYFPSSCDEELVDEADEPPDLSFLFSQSYHPTSLSDSEFAKHSIRNSAPTESLLTKALANPNLRPGITFDRTPTRPQRSPSTSSTWSASSAASTVDLISDGITSPSRANTPSPPHPTLYHGFPGILQKPKIAFAVPSPSRTDFAKQEVEPQTRKPCITFACVGRQSPAADVEQQQAKTQVPDAARQPVVPKKSALTFACDLPAKPREESSPTSPAKEKASEPVEIRGRETEEDKYSREPKRFDDAEGGEDSWANQPIDHSKLLRVDDVLKKERDIRKLSEEAEREAKLENGEDDDDEDEEQDDDYDGADVDDEDDDDEDDEDEDDNDDGYNRDSEEDDDEDDNEYDYDSEDERIGGLSGNETDNESGFASDSDSDDDLLFFGPHPPFAPAKPDKPPCCRIPSHSSTDSLPRRPSPPITTSELPDSTDFVCGTLDEDRALEEAFFSALENRKAKAKGKPTPQDIDPSFPVSEPESDDDEETLHPIRKVKPMFSRSPSSVERRSRHHSPPPSRRSRCHSPAPSRRIHSPAPTARRFHSPPPPTRSNRSSRHTSPRGTPPGGLHFGTIAPPRRTRASSLPRTSACVKRAMKTHTKPMQIKRGAADIVKGLEKRRERRKAKREVRERDGGKKGEGAEKMRELALEMCGKGKARGALWVISA